MEVGLLLLMELATVGSSVAKEMVLVCLFRILNCLGIHKAEVVVVYEYMWRISMDNPACLCLSRIKEMMIGIVFRIFWRILLQSRRSHIKKVAIGIVFPILNWCAYKFRVCGTGKMTTGHLARFYAIIGRSLSHGASWVFAFLKYSLRRCKNNLVLFTALLLVVSAISSPNVAQASAWTRASRDIFLMGEAGYSWGHGRGGRGNKYDNYYAKILGEYGLLDSLTVGGYLKAYHFEITSGLDRGKASVKGDIYSNAYLAWNIAKSHRGNALSIKYGYYFPIETGRYSSLNNYAESRRGHEISLMLGLGFGEDSVPFSKYHAVGSIFLNAKIGLRLLEDSFYDQINSETTVGFRINSSFFMYFQHSLRYDYIGDFKKVSFSNGRRAGVVIEGLSPSFNHDLSGTHHKFSISSVFRFSDTLSTEIGVNRTFADACTTGVKFSVLLDF